VRQTKCAYQKSGDFHLALAESGAVIEYKIHFYRKTDVWYDEVRYDSHEIKPGRKILAPHLHVKLATPFKDPKEGEQELKRIIDTVLPELKEITQ
jgi:hypothetical protein